MKMAYRKTIRFDLIKRCSNEFHFNELPEARFGQISFLNGTVTCPLRGKYATFTFVGTITIRVESSMVR